MPISLNLDEDQSKRLEARARELGVGVRELAVAAVNDLLCRQDDDFDRAAKSVLEKNTNSTVGWVDAILDACGSS